MKIKIKDCRTCLKIGVNFIENVLPSSYYAAAAADGGGWWWWW